MKSTKTWWKLNSKTKCDHSTIQANCSSVADFTSKLNKWSPKQDGQQYDVYEWFKLQKEVDPKVLEAIEKSKQKQLLKSQENAEKDQEFWKGV